MNVTSRTGLAMNNEFKFYTSYLIFKEMLDEGILEKSEFQIIVYELIEKYDSYILPFMFDIT